jgi:hypothetical protein
VTDPIPGSTASRARVGVLPVISRARAKRAARRRRRRHQLPGRACDRRPDRSDVMGRSRVPVLRIRRHRADVFILGDRAREPSGRHHGARAEGTLATPTESLVTGATDSARPLRRRFGWARSLRDRGDRTPLVRTTESPAEKGPRWCASCHFNS